MIGPLTEPLVEGLEPGTTVVGMRFVRARSSGRAAAESEVAGLALDDARICGAARLALGEAVGTGSLAPEALAALQLHVRTASATGEPPDPSLGGGARPSGRGARRT